ncbi:MAG: HlyD family type I secretion periplasmic adaptor subunit [Pseudomonadota bacterium]
MTKKTPAAPKAKIAQAPSIQKSIRGYGLAAAIAMVLLVGGIGGWAANAQISGAVYAIGELILDGRSHEVQHRDGGIVLEMRVRDGDLVQAGDPLFSMDPAELEASFAIVDNQIVERLARRARLDAELSADGELVFPDALMDRFDEPFVAQLMRQEAENLHARATTIDGQTNQLRERIRQTNGQIVGLRAQVEAKREELRLIAEERESLDVLFGQGLVESSRVLALDRTKARLAGEEGALVASIGQAGAEISQIEMQILQIRNDFRTRALEELTTVRSELAQLNEQLSDVRARLGRLDVRAPLAGVVHELALTSPGALVAAERTVLKLVPVQNRLIVEARIQPQDIDQIRVGDEATLRFSAFNQRTTPEIFGTVTHLSADRSDDQQTGASWYTARLQVNDEEKQRLGDDLSLIPGMPVDVFMQTEQRTVLSYLMKPLTDHLQRAFIED